MGSEQSKRDHQIATEIMDQMGALPRRLIGFNLPSCGNDQGDSYLQFRIKGAKTVNAMRIILRPSDTYTPQAYKANRLDWEFVGEETDIYNDGLLASIERLTGLYTSLSGGRIGEPA